MAENIIIPQQIYLGFREDTDAKLGFGTYYENNAACRKRQSTVDNWVVAGTRSVYDPNTRSYGEREVIAATIEGNLPQSGFKLSKKVTHGGGWNDLSVYWRIVDPRGFEFEISSGNLAKLFQYCDISKGNISGDCVWGWDKANGSKVVLLPVNSEIYLESQKSTDLHYAEVLTPKNIQRGNFVSLKNGQSGIFLGEMFIVKNDEDGKCEAQKTFVILNQTNSNFYCVKTPKIVSSVPADKQYTQDEAIELVNTSINNGVSAIYASSYGMHGNTIYASNNPDIISNIKFKYTYITSSAIVALIRASALMPDYRRINCGDNEERLLRDAVDKLYHLSYNMKTTIFGINEDRSGYRITGCSYRCSYNRGEQHKKFIKNETDNLSVSGYKLRSLASDVGEGIDYYLEFDSRHYQESDKISREMELSNFKEFAIVTLDVDGKKEVNFYSY